MNPEIYLDANATSPVMEAAIAAASGALREGFGNPSSTHGTGLRARALLDDVRARARRVLGADSGRISFTSGATEGIQTAILSALCAVRDARERGEPTGQLLVYGATEHKAVPESLAHWNRLLGTGLELVKLPVDEHGQHRLDVLRELAPRAAMVCTMAANNETGAISDLDGIAAVLRETISPAYWMVDSVQALGKLPLTLSASAIDYAPFSGHKLYAPKGIGMLYVRDGAPYTPLMCGGGQEAGLRAGTENMAGVAALGAVLAALEEGSTFRSHDVLVAYRARLADALRAAMPDIVFNCAFDKSLPTTLNFSVPGLSSKELLNLFDAAGVRVSAGSACSSALAVPSYVLEAMQLPGWRTAAAVRMSFGPMADDAFIDAACGRIVLCGQALRHICADTGLVQMTHDGHVTWLVLDKTQRSCIVIDPVPALAERIDAFVRSHACDTLAILSTAGSAGWPPHCTTVMTAHGALDAIGLGARVLVRLPDAAGVSYLLGTCDPAGLLASAAVTHAFTGAAMSPLLPAVVGPQTILCSSRDTGRLPCTTLAARETMRAACAAQRELDRAALARLLADHPQARLVDVREPFEHAAGDTGFQGVQNVPLSRLAERLGSWLTEPAIPLVFFCRSGARSAKAVECMQRLGFASAWHLAGGIALSGGAGTDT
ncbi:aminotransferase class V-fold PLP-dependent enzyme [Massilia sp. PAMC28688]|uniref:aminotransferase class V-fold PLP-dependent enzyme n=1 Tax=Massilia sp. PAMC28688 TaxID=2861283 RepID=UPI001C62A7BF|nr:aminotransferase class V-fold PLP-dependent enzyme [Massilia sp. PAMC28688]QYF94883.1 aminotransferase class V-fold PLP-dependent enzyme [Massilia sp. PAMC28688]